MSKLFQIIICTLLLLQHSAWCLWEYAVTTKSKIIFYDDDWREVTTAAHQFYQLSAITFDESEEIIYFNDHRHNNGSIFSLKIPLGEPHIIEKIVQRTENETVTSLAFDPLNRYLYWVDRTKRAIFYTPIDASNIVEPKVFLDFNEEHTMPDGIALDICRRKLYWTNSNFTAATIERCNLDDTNLNREVLVNENLFLPHGIVVDQLSNRIYWVVDQKGLHFSVESSNLDGSDRQVIVKGLNHMPLNLAVTNNEIVWTDFTSKSIWKYPKFLNESRPYTVEKVKSFNEVARGIIGRSRFLTKWQNDPYCSPIVDKIKARILSPKTTKKPTDRPHHKITCLNGGELVEQTGICICKMGFKGAFCETSECHNFCVHGTCSMSSMGFPECICQSGFYGERCQSTKCAGYCLNDGLCKIESDSQPICECKNNYVGERCEKNSTEICALFCRLLKHEPNTYVPFGCYDICDALAESAENGHEIYALPTYKHLEVCRSATIWTNTVIIVLVAGVVLSCLLVVIIIQGVRRLYKPARPRIKKTFVVRKQTASSPDTPLTNRPIATEQCEITIENCCNMNICDTPCFDPKLVSQSLSHDANAKEDKKMLIHNMEDDLY